MSEQKEDIAGSCIGASIIAVLMATCLVIGWNIGDYHGRYMMKLYIRQGKLPLILEEIKAEDALKEAEQKISETKEKMYYGEGG